MLFVDMRLHFAVRRERMAKYLVRCSAGIMWTILDTLSLFPFISMLSPQMIMQVILSPKFRLLALYLAITAEITRLFVHRKFMP